jgi:Domain of unknown function (DUF1843)
MSDGNYGPITTLYAGPIHEAARSGDAARMREMQQRAEQHLSEVQSALEELRAAIGRAGGS